MKSLKGVGCIVVPFKLSALIGKTGAPVILEVEKGAIRKYADAVGDRNPLYWDETYARRSGHGRIVAPPGFFGWPVKWDNAMPFFNALKEEVVGAAREEGYTRLLDGGIEFNFMGAILAGDLLTAVNKVADIYERNGKAGKLIFAVLETSYLKQDNTMVAIARQTLIFMR